MNTKGFMVKHLDIESEVQAVKTNIQLVEEPHPFFLTILVKITLSLSWHIEFVFGYELFPHTLMSNLSVVLDSLLFY